MHLKYSNQTMTKPFISCDACFIHISKHLSKVKKISFWMLRATANKKSLYITVEFLN